jgi:SAM-dependent methyltransferase
LSSRPAIERAQVKTSYNDLFEVRGSAYDHAMRQYPDARDAEFQQVVSRAHLTSGACVADVPAGGGYLKAYLPNDVTWLGHEPCAGFHHDRGASSPPVSVPLLPLPWRDHSVDVIISLAGVHHIENKRPLFSAFHSVLKPGGRLILSDVAAGSDTAFFLDHFVGAHNSTGHQGIYLDQDTLGELEEAGLIVSNSEIASFYWRFDNQACMTDFCRLLFDLRNTPDATIARVIERQLGVDVLPSGHIGMKWSLMTITARKWA